MTAAPGSGSLTICSTCWPVTAGWTCRSRRRGDLQTGAHHTVEDVGICLGQALDRALGDRAQIARYGQATVPMDESRAACAIDISGRGLCAFEGELPPGAIGNFDHELTEEFLRALAANARLTLHVTVAGRYQRPPRDRGGVQGAGSGSARCDIDRPDRAGRPEHEGDPLLSPGPSIAVLDYGMGNRRSVQKALQTVGARSRSPVIMTSSPRLTGSWSPASARFRRRCAT